MDQWKLSTLDLLIQSKQVNRVCRSDKYISYGKS